VWQVISKNNIAPTQEAPVIVQAAGKRTLELFRWGLIPWWANDPAIGNRMINARAETLAEKPAIKDLLGKRRCLYSMVRACVGNRLALNDSIASPTVVEMK
jgi:putative SOS response-associated peptidase YedK